MESDIDDLFRLPLTEFTAARNALAARLKKSGKIDEANRVKAMSKPSVSAWAVNQLYWKHREAFDALMRAGEQVVKAHALQLAGKTADTRAPLAGRREAAALGHAERYHETITWAYLALVNERLHAADAPADFDAFAGANPDLFDRTGGALARLYDRATLESPLARRVFLLPRSA